MITTVARTTHPFYTFIFNLEALKIPLHQGWVWFTACNLISLCFHLCLRSLLDYCSTVVTICSNPNTSRGCICQYTQKPRIPREFLKTFQPFLFCCVFIPPLFPYA